MIQRRDVLPGDLEGATMAIIDDLNRRLQKHGNGAYASKHEAFGVVAEELDELKEALRDDSRPWRFDEELRDVAVACIFALASGPANARGRDVETQSGVVYKGLTLPELIEKYEETQRLLRMPSPEAEAA